MTNRFKDNPLIVYLHGEEELDPALAGSKGTGLGRLIRVWDHVPCGFIITTQAFRFHLERSGLGKEIREELKAALSAGLDRVMQVTAKIRKLLETTTLPPELLAVIEKAYLDINSPPVAVRSSSVTEDLPGASFAGQYLTQLCVRGIKILSQAIQKVFASLYSERSISYRFERRISIEGAEMAVIVQEMIPSESSGVMFTRDPVGLETDVMIIDAVYGLGEGLVSGRLPADHFVLNRKTGGLIKQIQAEKIEQVICDEKGGVRLKEVPEYRRKEPVLDERKLEALWRLGLKVEQVFGCPQDIEWTLHGRDIYLLQSRPITTTRTEEEVGSIEELLESERARLRKKAKGKEVVWSNVAFGELIPDPTPISFEAVKRMASRDGGVPTAYRKDLGLGGEAADKSLEMICGRVYVDLEKVIPLFIPRGLPLVPRLVEELKKNEPHPSPPSMSMSGWQVSLRPSWRDLFLWPFHLWRILNLAIRFNWTKKNFDRRYRMKILPAYINHLDELKNENLEMISDEELLAGICKIFDSLFHDPRRWWEVGNILSIFTFELLTKVTHRWFNDRNGTIVTSLGRGLDWNRTLDMNRALDRIARQGEGEPDLTEFLREYGHRGIDELELARPRWREDPSFLINQIQGVRKGQNALGMDEVFEQHRRERLDLEQMLMKKFRWKPLKRFIWRHILRDAQTYAPYRETPKYYFLIEYAELRRRLLEAGRRLSRSNILNRIEDVFYLATDEIEQALRGNLPVVRSIAEKRRRERELGLTIILPPVIKSDRLEETLAPCRPEKTTELKGLPVSPGQCTGIACVVLDPDQAKSIGKDAILVAPYTDPSWTPAFLNVKALVTDIGSSISHGSIIAREYGLPAVVNTQIATRIIRSGQRITVNGTKGIVYVYE